MNASFLRNGCHKPGRVVAISFEFVLRLFTPVIAQRLYICNVIIVVLFEPSH